MLLMNGMSGPSINAPGVIPPRAGVVANAPTAPVVTASSRAVYMPPSPTTVARAVPTSVGGRAIPVTTVSVASPQKASLLATRTGSAPLSTLLTLQSGSSAWRSPTLSISQQQSQQIPVAPPPMPGGSAFTASSSAGPSSAPTYEDDMTIGQKVDLPPEQVAEQIARNAAIEQAENAAKYKRWLIWGGIGAGALGVGYLLFGRSRPAA